MPVCKGSVATVITKSSKIFCIGNMESKLDKTVALLKLEGFTNVEAMDAFKLAKDEIKAILTKNPGCLLFVEGTLEQENGALMQDLYAFLRAEAPTVACYVLSPSDFPAKTGSPPSAEEIAGASFSCIKKLVAKWEPKG